MIKATVNAARLSHYRVVKEKVPGATSIFEREGTVGEVRFALSLSLPRGVDAEAISGATHAILYGKTQPHRYTVVDTSVSPASGLLRRWRNHRVEITVALDDLLAGTSTTEESFSYFETAILYRQTGAVPQAASLAMLAGAYDARLSAPVQRLTRPGWLSAAAFYPSSPEETTPALYYPPVVEREGYAPIALLSATAWQAVAADANTTLNRPHGYYLIEARVPEAEGEWHRSIEEVRARHLAAVPEGSRVVDCFPIASIPHPEDYPAWAEALGLPPMGEDAYEMFYDLYWVWLTGELYCGGVQVGGYARPLQGSVYEDIAYWQEEAGAPAAEPTGLSAVVSNAAPGGTEAYGPPYYGVDFWVVEGERLWLVGQRT